MLETSRRVLVQLRVNGVEHEVDVFPMARLLDVLRDELCLTGVKEGCGEGECGSCAVLLDGRLVNSCLVPILQVQGSQVHTVEWLSSTPAGRRIQECFRDCGGAQCGICTPGMLLASYCLLNRQPRPTLEDVRTGLAGNLCRCTGYTKIFDSVLEAARRGEAGS